VQWIPYHQRFSEDDRFDQASSFSLNIDCLKIPLFCRDWIRLRSGWRVSPCWKRSSEYYWLLRFHFASGRQLRPTILFSIPCKHV
jgi:hypothetical protein